jgi:hypothetical protein
MVKLNFTNLRGSQINLASLGNRLRWFPQNKLELANVGYEHRLFL